MYVTPGDSLETESFPIKPDAFGNYRLRKFRNPDIIGIEGYWLACKDLARVPVQ